MKVAISGASGKTGYRIAEEAIAAGYEVRLLIRDSSHLPQSLIEAEKYIISLSDQKTLDIALEDCDALIIATGARPSIDLTGPARIDALGVQKQSNPHHTINLNPTQLESAQAHTARNPPNSIRTLYSALEKTTLGVG